MVAHQPCDGLGFGLVQPEARAKLHRNLGPKLAMIAAPPLGDVVEQHGDVEHSARGYLVEQLGRKRMIVGKLAALDFRQQPDRPDRMLVDRIMVVHVELHLGDDAAEVGNEPAEHAGLVHPAKRDIGLVACGQHLKEECIGTGIVADLVRMPRVAGRGPHRKGMNFQSFPRCEREQFDQPHRILSQPAVVRNRQAAAVEDKAVKPFGAPLQCGKRKAPAALAHLLVKLGKKQSGEVADRLSRSGNRIA